VKWYNGEYGMSDGSTAHTLQKLPDETSVVPHHCFLGNFAFDSIDLRSPPRFIEQV
jgi:hypothetical protein